MTIAFTAPELPSAGVWYPTRFEDSQGADDFAAPHGYALAPCALAMKAPWELYLELLTVSASVSDVSPSRCSCSACPATWTTFPSVPPAK